MIQVCSCDVTVDGAHDFVGLLAAHTRAGQFQKLLVLREPVTALLAVRVLLSSSAKHQLLLALFMRQCAPTQQLEPPVLLLWRWAR